MARLEIDIVAKNAGGAVSAIKSTSNAVSSLEKRYEQTRQAANRLNSESIELEAQLRALRASFESGAISESKFNKQSQDLSNKLMVVRGNIFSVNSQLTSFKKTIEQVNNPTRSLGTSMNKLQGYSNDFTSGIRSANAVSIEFSRIIQDAPYGLQGIGNNIQQLTQNWAYYTRAAKEAAAAQGQTLSTGKLLGGAFRSLLSPVNLLTLGISAVTAGVIAYQRWQQKANKEAKEAEKTTKDNVSALNEYIDSLSSAERLQAKAGEGYAAESSKARLLYERTQDLTLSTKDRSDAVDSLKKQFPTYFSGLSNEAILAGNAADEYRRLTENLIASATARASEDLIGSAIKERINLGIQERDRIKQINELNRERADLEKQIVDERERSVSDINTGAVLGEGYVQGRLQAVDKLVERRRQVMQEIKNLSDETNDSTGRQAEIQSDIAVYTDEWNKASSEILETAGRFQKINSKSSKDAEKMAKKFESAEESLRNLSNNASQGFDILVRSGLDADDEATKQKYDALGIKAGEAFVTGLHAAAGDPEKIRAITEGYEQAMADIEIQRGAEHEQNAKKYEETEKKVADISIAYSRRVFQTRSQLMLRALNSEYKQKVDAANKEYKSEEERLQKQAQLQEEYWNRVEEIQKFKELEDLAYDLGDAVGDAFEGMLLDGKNVFESLFQEFKRMVVRMVAQQAALKATNFFGKILGLGSSVAAGSGGGLVKGIIKGIGKFLGFAQGGYTGGGNRNDISGVVHGQEFVVNADATRDYLPLLQAINSGQRLSAPPIVSAGAGTISSNRPVTVNVVGKISGNDLQVVGNRASRFNQRFNGGQ